MSTIQNIFSNRELSIILWLIIILISVPLIKPLRKPLIIFLRNIIQILAKGRILIVFLSMIIYWVVILLFIKILTPWEPIYFKDFIFWLLLVGFSLVFKSIQAKNSKFFLNIFLAGFKWTIILEFIANLYCFSLLTEFILFGLLSFTGILRSVSELDKNNAQVTKVLSFIFNTTLIIMFFYSVIKTIIEYDKLLTISNFMHLLLPTVITILFIPFIYILATYSAYETFFIRLSIMTDRKEKVLEIKKLVWKTAYLNIDLVKRIMSNFDKSVFYNEVELKSYIKEISRIRK